MSTSRFNGEMATSKLSVEPGAEFTGSCSMGAVVRDLVKEEDEDQKEKTA